MQSMVLQPLFQTSFPGCVPRQEQELVFEVTIIMPSFTSIWPVPTTFIEALTPLSSRDKAWKESRQKKRKPNWSICFCADLFDWFSVCVCVRKCVRVFLKEREMERHTERLYFLYPYKACSMFISLCFYALGGHGFHSHTVIFITQTIHSALTKRHTARRG